MMNSFINLSKESPLSSQMLQLVPEVFYIWLPLSSIRDLHQIEFFQIFILDLMS